MTQRKTMVCIAGMLACAIAMPRTAGADNAETAKIVSAYSSITEGQVMKGIGFTGNLDHTWIQSIAGGIGCELRYNRNIRGFVRGDATIDFSYNFPLTNWSTESNQDMKITRYSFLLRHAEGVYTAGDGDSLRYPFQIGTGLFPYKYNPDVRNLGEYLFRGNAYPNYFYNEFDAPLYRMAGVRASTRPFEGLKIEGLLTSEIVLIPQGDFSLAFVGNYTLLNFLSIGAGIDFYRLFSVSPFTTPGAWTKERNLYRYTVDSTYDSIMGQWLTKKTNIEYYTYKATKEMFRFSIDPKKFIPGDLFGAEDLKIYGELGILGVKNYPDPTNGIAYYGKLSERMPMMIGFNFPAFKILDVLTMELERYKSPYPPSYETAFRDGSAEPLSTKSIVPHPVKWSFYAKKDLAAFSIIAQAARDHFQPNINNITLTERTDVLPHGDDWWWALRVNYGF